MSHTEQNRYLELFCQLLLNEGYKCTVLRRNIIKILFTEQHISVPQLHRLLHDTYHLRPSLPAVYANMRLLYDYSIVSKSTHQGKTVYRLTRGSDHIHLHCIHCDTIVELQDETLIEAIRQRCHDDLFYPQQYDLVLRGICKHCNNDNHLN